MSGSELPFGWADLAICAPEGLAVVDPDGLFVQLNAAGVELCACPAEGLIGTRAPFELTQHRSAEPLRLLDDGATEQLCTWAPTAGVRREFAYRTRLLSADTGHTVVAFRDVGRERHRQRRVAAIARSATKLASEGSITATLDTLAREVLQADALAGVQILTLDESNTGLRIMGSAGFRRWPDFFERLMQCRERGASLKMLESLQLREPIVVADRWDAIQRDPSWEPLHEYLGELEWDWFASVPLITRGRSAGVLNAFFVPGQVVGQRTLEFLLAMAEQAAIAVDYASLLQNERELARREERQRLARDLHDSVVQQVFSIGMQAKSMGVVGARGTDVSAESVRRFSEEVGRLSRTVLADLRAMVHELRPSSSVELGLGEAVRALVTSTINRTPLEVSLSVGQGLDRTSPEMAEDVYRILAEALHNVVKHAQAEHVTIRLGVDDDSLRATISDDGRGVRDDGDPDSGYGLTGMRERAERWGGTVHIRARSSGGTSVRVLVPLLLPVLGNAAQNGVMSDEHTDSEDCTS
ncbi:MULTISPECIES: sensor histidine kinase [Prauserella salsuginis group]|uniref:ATP-binding protein n=1 Tax=Prauserella salsuginis TaxID=387889 RepID=A0ABW6G0R5_9PSEU|nr:MULTISPECIES: ATP-binding protein [Prauserella salsuginis group]MCR3721954.1 Histidine kinase-, DNA gyrase B-, and HSP90-like ATPase [Prauserella flava]MCR3735960.1 Histidine kinase-, DNA gyrase B-, and HSP90-like ATPase [Prauserella salsuginis]